MLPPCTDGGAPVQQLRQKGVWLFSCAFNLSSLPLKPWKSCQPANWHVGCICWHRLPSATMKLEKEYDYESIELSHTIHAKHARDAGLLRT